MPQEDRHQIFEWTTAFVDYSDRELGQSSERLRDAAIGVATYGRALIAKKRAAPGDDMLSIVVHAEIPDESGTPRRLGDDELIPFLTLLLVAGTETTRNAIAGGLLALIEHPAELAALRADRALLPRAVEEILRWTSPTTYNRRTATRDVELGGQQIRAGDKVTHWYPSANRDDAVFAEADAFRVARDDESASRLRPRRAPLPRREPRARRDRGGAGGDPRARSRLRDGRRRRVGAEQQAHGDAADAGAGDAHPLAAPCQPSARLPASDPRIAV